MDSRGDFGADWTDTVGGIIVSAGVLASPGGFLGVPLVDIPGVFFLAVGVGRGRHSGNELGSCNFHVGLLATSGSSVGGCTLDTFGITVMRERTET
jgi:hypothetical protein